MSARILCAESDLARRRSERLRLEAAGSEVGEAGDVEAARRILGQGRLDLALIDAGMGWGSAAGLLGEIRSADALERLPVIILGGTLEGERTVQWLEAGADATLSRPYSLAVLVAQVGAMLRRSRCIPAAG